MDTKKAMKNIDEKIAQLQNRKKIIAKQEREKAKKERTRLLIQYGELVEKYFNGATLEEIEKIFETVKISEPAIFKK